MGRKKGKYMFWIILGVVLIGAVLLLALGYIFYKAWEDMRETPKF